MAEFYCYVFRRPDGSPFYVGYGQRARVFKQGWSRPNADVIRILAEIRRSGQMPHRTLEVFPTADEAKARELELIKQWGRIVDGGLLANLRIGDRGGVQGRTLSPDHVEKLQAARPPHTEEFKRKMSQRMKGNKYAQTKVTV